MPAEDDVELLAALILLMLRHQPVPRLSSRPHVRAERSDPEMMADGPHMGVLAVGDVPQLVDGRNLVIHQTSQLLSRSRASIRNTRAGERASCLVLVLPIFELGPRASE